MITALGLGLGLPMFGWRPGSGGGLRPALDIDFVAAAAVRTLDPRLTFSRSSLATEIGADGLVRWCDHNLLPYSANPMAGWSNGGGIYNGTDVGPGDAIGAAAATRRITASSAAVGGWYRAIGTPPTGQPFIIAAYVARVSGTGNYYLGSDSGGRTKLVINPATGAIVAGPPVRGVSAVSGGWLAWAQYTGDGAVVNAVSYCQSSALVVDFAAWAHYGAVLQPYCPTATAAYYAPRWQYDPVTLAPLGILLEPQATQLAANGGLGGTTPTQTITAGAEPYTLSFYGSGQVVLSGAHSATVVGTGDYPARCTYTFTPSAGALTATVSGSVTGAQLEAGALATSLIPNPAAGASVTRAADSLTLPTATVGGVGTIVIAHQVPAGGVVLGDGPLALLTSTGPGRSAIAYDGATIRVCHRGGAVTSSAGAVGATLRVGGSSVSQGAGTYSRLTAYAAALSSAQLQALTS